jgi:hypothetical protein
MSDEPQNEKEGKKEESGMRDKENDKEKAEGKDREKEECEFLSILFPSFPLETVSDLFAGMNILTICTSR